MIQSYEHKSAWNTMLVSSASRSMNLVALKQIVQTLTNARGGFNERPIKFTFTRLVVRLTSFLEHQQYNMDTNTMNNSTPYGDGIQLQLLLPLLSATVTSIEVHIDAQCEWENRELFWLLTRTNFPHVKQLRVRYKGIDVQSMLRLLDIASFATVVQVDNKTEEEEEEEAEEAE